jgi:NAD(P)-dependent dehydrogenase (short-subunit alcohol dehydrogenase family)
VDGVAADLSTEEGAKMLFSRVQHLDVLVNNLGIIETRPFLEIDDADWRRFFETNVLSGVRITRHYLPQMLEKKWGRVTFISSESGVQIPAEMVHYGMTKTAQMAVARGIAESFPASGITLNSVTVGPTESEGVATFVESLAAQQARQKMCLPASSSSMPGPAVSSSASRLREEVAAMVVYLCSEAASATTGSAIRVDGGVIRAIA